MTPTDEKPAAGTAHASARPIKRSFSIAGHKTSISLETAFWDALKAAAREEQLSLAALVAAIDRGRGGANLSSAVRVWLLERAQARVIDAPGA
jgi:predicted DNA-binding ribbon-helix-helix protein